MPSQNSGIEYKTNDPIIEVRSNVLPRRHPDRIPIQIPMIVENSVDTPTSRSVGHRNRRNTSITGSPW
jgi:hypothetical protein